MCAEQIQPGIILMDVEMSGLNGDEACDILKHTPSIQHIAMVFVSSLSNLTSRMQGHEVGGDDDIDKPFDKVELPAKMQLQIKQ